jgi:hypothetical protein
MLPFFLKSQNSVTDPAYTLSGLLFTAYCPHTFSQLPFPSNSFPSTFPSTFPAYLFNLPFLPTVSSDLSCFCDMSSLLHACLLCYMNLCLLCYMYVFFVTSISSLFFMPSLSRSLFPAYPFPFRLTSPACYSK